MADFGLLGKGIDYSFSRGYFREKFERLALPHHYRNYDVADLSSFPQIISENPELRGLNVTIPYKEEIFAYLDTIDPIAAEIGAVNTIKIDRNGKTTGYNTDYWGFRESLKKLLPTAHRAALILGTGGASKAIAYALRQLDFEITFVSRNASNDTLLYTDLTPEIMGRHSLIVNCTPLGTHPNIGDCPPIPYDQLGPSHLLYDLIYNPAKTTFLQRGETAGSRIKNGLEMLELQAEESWRIWMA